MKYTTQQKMIVKKKKEIKQCKIEETTIQEKIPQKFSETVPAKNDDDGRKKKNCHPGYIAKEAFRRKALKLCQWCKLPNINTPTKECPFCHLFYCERHLETHQTYIPKKMAIRTCPACKKKEKLKEIISQ